MELNQQEQGLIGAFRRLPPKAASEIASLVERLAADDQTRKVDWSDAWSDADLAAYSAAYVRTLEDREKTDPV
jgi:hypothetical protein